MIISPEAAWLLLAVWTAGAAALLTLGGIVCRAACRERRGRATPRP